MTSRRYVPDSGDVVWLDFTPQAGHEQAGRGPALVLSPAPYNDKTGLMICCPMTTQIKRYPFEVPIAGRAGWCCPCRPGQEPGLAQSKSRAQGHSVSGRTRRCACEDTRAHRLLAFTSLR